MPSDISSGYSDQQRYAIPSCGNNLFDRFLIAWDLVRKSQKRKSYAVFTGLFFGSRGQPRRETDLDLIFNPKSLCNATIRRGPSYLKSRIVRKRRNGCFLEVHGTETTIERRSNSIYA